MAKAISKGLHSQEVAGWVNLLCGPPPTPRKSEDFFIYVFWKLSEKCNKNS